MSLEYIAGFFDGEGSIGVYPNGQGRYHLRTQLTQNVTGDSTKLFEAVITRFGGNLAEMRSAIYRGGKAFNWQVNGTRAASMLTELYNHLRLKHDQATVAIAWQARQPGPQRDVRGRMVAQPPDPIDHNVYLLLRELKKFDLAYLLESKPEYKEVMRVLGL